MKSPLGSDQPTPDRAVVQREPSIPPVPAWFQNGFHRFLRRFLRKHFHAVAIASRHRIDSTLSSDLPLIVYGNHPSWWDPLIAHFLNRTLFPDRQFYAPIDADSLQQYRVFAKLGFYGVRLNSASGAGEFLKQSTSILNADNTALWLTPEGRFCDVRDHSAELMPGLSHLCHRNGMGIVVPLAMEYVFWDDRLPVCLAMLGDPIELQSTELTTKSEWNRVLSDRLRSTQTALSELAISRCSDQFTNLLTGDRGAGAFYDSLRRMSRWLRRQPFRAQHGNQFQ